MTRIQIKENFFSDDEPGQGGVDNAWRCNNCKELMYNLRTKQGITYPAPGAPFPNFYNDEFPQLCSVCRDLLWVVSNSDYWRQISEMALAEKKPRVTNKWNDHS